MTTKKTALTTLGAMLLATLGRAASHPVVDTGQATCYDAAGAAIACPAVGQPFHGQDAQFDGIQPSYVDNGDGTISDRSTGLMWQKNPNGFVKMTWDDAKAGAAAATTGGHADWRLPTIKELYSLIDFRGVTGTSAADSTPYIDTTYFDFAYGNTSAGERFIDAQYASITPYASTVMSGDDAAFGVNFADGRIKGYGLTDPMGNAFRFCVRYVRGAAGYGATDLVDGGDGTITDRATGLMWSKGDSGQGMTWQEALAWVDARNAAGYLGHADWRLPNAKELQGIVDYTRCPDVTGSAAIDPVFSATAIVDEGGGTNYAFYWASTTHLDGPVGVRGTFAVYVAFGEALGWMEVPPSSGQYQLWDVHGAGSQRSDPKSGDPANWPHGNGPQGDVVRIDNFVRLVRDASAAAGERILAGAGPGASNPNEVRVLSQGGVVDESWLAYGAGAWGTNVADGDLDGTAPEAVTGPGPGAVFGPQVRAFRGDGTSVTKVSFYAYGTLRYGVNVGAGSIDADGFAEMVTGGGPGAVFGPHVRAFDYDGVALAAVSRVSFFAYSTLRYGVEVAAGDLDGDGRAEMVTGPGPSAAFAPQVRGFDYDGTAVAAIARINFDAFQGMTHGCNVGLGDTDGDGRADGVLGPGPAPASAERLRGFDLSAGAVAALPGFDAVVFPGLAYGLTTSAADLDGDGRAEALAGQGADPAAGSRVESYAYDGAALAAMPGWGFDAFGLDHGVALAGAAF